MMGTVGFAFSNLGLVCDIASISIAEALSLVAEPFAKFKAEATDTARGEVSTGCTRGVDAGDVLGVGAAAGEWAASP